MRRERGALCARYCHEFPTGADNIELNLLACNCPCANGTCVVCFQSEPAIAAWTAKPTCHRHTYCAKVMQKAIRMRGVLYSNFDSRNVFLRMQTKEANCYRESIAVQEAM